MATKQPTTDVRFIVDVSPNKFDGNRLDATVIPIIMEDGKIRNCQWSLFGDRGSEFADLKVTGWMYKTDDRADFYYGYNPLEYSEVFSLDLSRAEVMVKTLRRLEKKIETLNLRFGSPTDFAAYLGYLASAVMGFNSSSGLSIFAVKQSGQGWSYDDSTYRWLDVNDLRYYFQDRIAKWKDVS